MSKKALTASLAAAGVLASSFVLSAGAAAPVDGGLTLTMGPHAGPYSPGEMATATAMGNPGDYVLFMLDMGVGASVLPLKGGIAIDLPQSSFFFTLTRRLDSAGKAEVMCAVDCDAPDFFGIEFCVQALSYNPTTKEICKSNVACFEWEDDGSCNGQGCTPGYWKQGHHAGNWPAPYTPATLFSDVFEDAFPGKTLDDVLETGGGELDALGRHTVAALLNAHSAGVNYYLGSAQDVIDKFNAVYPGTDAEYEALKDEFAANNELGCPLGNVK